MQPRSKLGATLYNARTLPLALSTTTFIQFYAQLALAAITLHTLLHTLVASDAIPLTRRGKDESNADVKKVLMVILKDLRKKVDGDRS